MKRPEVIARVQELSEHYRLNPPPLVVDPTPDPAVKWVTAGYVRANRMSEECGDRSSLIAGLSAVAKLKAYLVDRVEPAAGPFRSVIAPSSTRSSPR